MLQYSVFYNYLCICILFVYFLYIFLSLGKLKK